MMNCRRGLRKKAGYGILLFALSVIFITGTAFADGVILAPGVTLPGQQPAAGPGAQAAESAGDSGAAAAGTSDAGTAEAAASDAGASDAGAAEAGADAGADAAAGAADIESLKARSLQEQYTIFPTSDPNIVVSRGRTINVGKPLLALTYDDGPQTEAGNRIIDSFDQYGQRTTFFMVGDRVPSRASEVRRMASEGHEVANHTYSHTYLNKVGAEAIRSQVAQCNDVIEQTCGIRPRIMRLPGGNKNSTVLANVNMPIILWNVDTRDWDHRNASRTVDAIIGKVKDGDVVLMHELYGATADAAAVIVPQLVSQGFELVTVSELAQLKGKALTPNSVYYSF